MNYEKQTKEQLLEHQEKLTKLKKYIVKDVKHFTNDLFDTLHETKDFSDFIGGNGNTPIAEIVAFNGDEFYTSSVFIDFKLVFEKNKKLILNYFSRFLFESQMSINEIIMLLIRINKDLERIDTLLK